MEVSVSLWCLFVNEPPYQNYIVQVFYQEYMVNLTLIATKQTLLILLPYYGLNVRKKS